MKSHLEEKTGYLLDQLQINWEYEPEHIKTDLGYYKPDFKLNSEQFIESKGRERGKDIRKTRELVRQGKEVILITTNGAQYLSLQSGVVATSPVHIIKCSNCKQHGFVPALYDWSCRKCGKHNGDQDITHRRMLENGRNKLVNKKTIEEIAEKIGETT